MQKFFRLPPSLQQQALAALTVPDRLQAWLPLLLNMEEHVHWLLAEEQQDLGTQSLLHQQAFTRLTLLRQVLPLAQRGRQERAAPPPWRAYQGKVKHWYCDSFSLELPLFALNAHGQQSRWHWQNRDGRRRLEVTLRDDTLGRASLYDRELLVYFASQLRQRALDPTQAEPPPRLRFQPTHFLRETGRDLGGRRYQGVLDSLTRLCNTQFQYSVAGLPTQHGQLLQSWRRQDDEHGVIEVELPSWLLQAVRQRELLLLHPEYLALRQPMARRLYELARKHCGRQRQWRIGLEALHLKSGSHACRREFRRMLRDIVARDDLPGYRLQLEGTSEQLLVSNREADVTLFHTRLSQIGAETYGKPPTWWREKTGKRPQ